MFKILVAEDEAHNREAIAEVLRRLGHEVVLASNGSQALELATKISFDLILSDVRMPQMDGLQFFEAFQRVNEGKSRTAFSFMTAYGRLEEAVSAMRKGALHFLSKPIRKKDLVTLLEEVEKERCALSWNSNKSETPATLRSMQDPMAVVHSKVFGDALEMVDRVSASLASVLLVGESGTGKEVLAKRLHQQSHRASGPFVAFHAGAVPDTLVESELFGAEKGAYTGADERRIGLIPSAHGGTFFLDEVGTMSLPTQAKLLRVIQERRVQPLGSSASIECDVRWVAATNVSLDEMVRQGKFREDLLYRLRVIVIEVPPLRERLEDLDALTDYFAQEFSGRDGRDPLLIPTETREILKNYAWPGNVRELRNVVERAFALAENNVFTPDLLPTHLQNTPISREIRVVVGQSLQSVEDQLIEETLRICNGDKLRAAEILSVSPRTIYRWIEKRTERTI